MKDVNNLLEHLKRIEVYRIPGSDGPMMASVSEETLVRTIAGIEQLKRERDGAIAALQEQLNECFDDRCEMCARHEALIRAKVRP